MNLYAYCGGDPINFLDPSGLAPGQNWFDELTGFNTTCALRGSALGGLINGLGNLLDEGGNYTRDHPFEAAMTAASMVGGIGEIAAAGRIATAGRVGGGLGRSVVLGTTQNDVLGKAQQALMRAEVMEGRIPVTATTNAWDNAAGFGREMSQFERIYFTSEGVVDTALTQKNVTYAEIEYLLRHPDLWGKTYPVW